MPFDIGVELAEQARELGLLGHRPAASSLVSHARRAPRNRLIVRRPWAVSCSRVARASSASLARLTWPDRSSCWAFRVTAGASMRSRSARSVSRRLVPPRAARKGSQAGLIDVDSRLREQELMQPDLPERASQRVQRRLDLADRLVVPGLDGGGG